MLDQIDMGRTIGKTVYHKRLPKLQQRLYDLEVEIIAARIPVVIVFEGWAGTSKIGAIGTIARRLDPRGLRIHPITPPRTSERDFPWLQRFWLRAPAYGEIAIFDRSWYREVLAGRTRKQLSQQAYLERCEDIVSFERQLTDDGVIMLKFILHITKHEQRQRFDELLADRLTAIQVTKQDLWQHHHYDRVLRVTEDLLARTNTGTAPWVAIPANDREYAQITVLEAVIDRLEARTHAQAKIEALAEISAAAPHNRQITELGVGTDQPAAEPTHAPAGCAYVATRGILRALDLTPTIADDDYDQKLTKLQAKLYLLGLEVYQQKRAVVLVFEGWDAAGKGGTIKRITEPLDPRSYVVHAIAKPEGDDKQRHYLYRFWRRLPAHGQIGIFDRSWYGRVLVERIEGFAQPDEWQRAFHEINDFERQLVDDGTVICKFWLHLSPAEQLRRFEERQSVRYKSWKLTDEDWRNREKWSQYEQAVDDMVAQTNTPLAPWTVVAAEDKRFGRVQVIREIVRRLEDDLGKVKL